MYVTTLNGYACTLSYITYFVKHPTHNTRNTTHDKGTRIHGGNTLYTDNVGGLYIPCINNTPYPGIINFMFGVT